MGDYITMIAGENCFAYRYYLQVDNLLLEIDASRYATWQLILSRYPDLHRDTKLYCIESGDLREGDMVFCR